MKINPLAAYLSFAMVSYLMFVLTGCFHFRNSNNLASLWFYTYKSDPRPDRNDSMTTAGMTPPELTPANFLELRPDGSYTRDFGRFEYGSWEEKNHRLSLTNQAHETAAYTVQYEGGEDMQMIVNNGAVAHFESHALPGSSPLADPFSKENNRWRMAATKKETDQDIRARLLNHCHFWVAYFTWALNNELASVDVRSTPTLLKIYGNGFTLKRFNDLPPEWRSYFYDAEDCRKASDQMKDVFQNHTIAWAHTDNKYKLFIGAFQQIEQALR